MDDFFKELGTDWTSAEWSLDPSYGGDLLSWNFEDLEHLNHASGNSTNTGTIAPTACMIAGRQDAQTQAPEASSSQEGVEARSATIPNDQINERL